MRKKIVSIILVLVSLATFYGCAKPEVKYVYDKDTGLGYNVCENLRFGHKFCYPLFLEPEGDAYNSSRISFASNDGKIKAVTSARINHSERSVKSVLDEEKYFLELSGCRITYEFSKNGLIVFTGFTPSGKIFYNKIAVMELFSPIYNDTRNVIARVDVVFDQDDRPRGEDITELLKKFPLNRNPFNSKK